MSVPCFVHNEPGDCKSGASDNCGRTGFGRQERMDADRHSRIDPRRRGFLTLWCFLLGLALLPIPAIRALSPELLFEALAGLSPDVPASGVIVVYAWLSLPAIPLIPLFLAWSLPGAVRPGLPKRSIGTLCLLIACHPFRFHFEGYGYSSTAARIVARLHQEFPLSWALGHLDTPLLIGLAAWAMLRRRTLRPKEKILFHWILFICALWAAGPLANDYFDFIFTF